MTLLRKFRTVVTNHLLEGAAVVLFAAILFVARVVQTNRDVGLLLASWLIAVFIGIVIGGVLRTLQLRQSETAKLEKAVADGNLLVLRAFYGAQGVWLDVTKGINAAIKEKKLKLDVNDVSLLSNEQKGRALAVEKHLILTYVFNEKVFAEKVKQNDRLNIKSDGIEIVRAGVAADSATWKREKVANIYWLGSDLMNTLCKIKNDDPAHILRNLVHINWHANKLELNHVPLWRLDKVLEQAKTYQEWNAQEREDIRAELDRLNEIMGNTMETADPDYHPEEIEKLTGLIRK